MRLKLDENGFKPLHAEILRRDAPSGPPGLLSSRLLVRTRPPVDFDLVAHGSERRAARAQHPEGLPLRQRVRIGEPLEPICARSAGTRDTPCVRSRNGPDADTAGRGNGRDLTSCKRQKTLEFTHKTLNLVRNSLCAVERRFLLAGAKPAQQLSLRLVAARAVHGGNEMG